MPNGTTTAVLFILNVVVILAEGSGRPNTDASAPALAADRATSAADLASSLGASSVVQQSFTAVVHAEPAAALLRSKGVAGNVGGGADGPLGEVHLDEQRHSNGVIKEQQPADDMWTAEVAAEAVGTILLEAAAKESAGGSTPAVAERAEEDLSSELDAWASSAAARSKQEGLLRLGLVQVEEEHRQREQHTQDSASHIPRGTGEAPGYSLLERGPRHSDEPKAADADEYPLSRARRGRGVTPVVAVPEAAADPPATASSDMADHPETSGSDADAGSRDSPPDVLDGEVSSTVAKTRRAAMMRAAAAERQAAASRSDASLPRIAQRLQIGQQIHRPLWAPQPSLQPSPPPPSSAAEGSEDARQKQQMQPSGSSEQDGRREQEVEATREQPIIAEEREQVAPQRPTPESKPTQQLPEQRAHLREAAPPSPPVTSTSLPDASHHSLVSQHRMVLLILVVIAGASIFGNACFAAGMCISSALWRRTKVSSVRRYVERLPVCGATEIAQRLPVVSGGYDCILSKPLSSKMLLRIEAVVERPVEGCQLMSPLTRKTCVLYSSAASRQLHDGVHPVPIAFAFASVNFAVRLVDAPEISVEIRGTDVSLFDMSRGRHVESRNFKRVPDDWQDFISSHRTSPHLSANLHTEGATLEFQECTLCVGARVTLVGELHRDANGTLSMRPWVGGEEQATPETQRESWRTSWEDWSCVDTSAVDDDSSPGAREHGDFKDGSGSTGDCYQHEAIARIEKVLISDNPELLRTFAPWRTVLAWRDSFLQGATRGSCVGGRAQYAVAGVLPGGCAAAFGAKLGKTPKDEA